MGKRVISFIFGFMFCFIFLYVVVGCGEGTTETKEEEVKQEFIEEERHTKNSLNEPMYGGYFIIDGTYSEKYNPYSIKYDGKIVHAKDSGVKYFIGYEYVTADLGYAYMTPLLNADGTPQLADGYTIDGKVEETEEIEEDTETATEIIED